MSPTINGAIYIQQTNTSIERWEKVLTITTKGGPKKNSFLTIAMSNLIATFSSLIGPM